MKSLQEKIKELVIEFVEDYKEKNAIHSKWRKPLIAFANAKDPIFRQLKQVADKDHRQPHELLKNAKSIISFFIPFNDEIVFTNSNGLDASKSWAIAYIETNRLIAELTHFLANSLEEMKYDCFEVAPTHNFDERKLISYWSHRHIAYIAGLGKFGLHNMLITEKGCCGRLGSLVTSALIDATERSEEEYCLYYRDESCKKCINKCVFDALHIDSFDRQKCYEICKKNERLYSHLGVSDVCGKCVCGIPCSLKNPCK
ncbi:MAG: epoxyqueuosine reductase [Candidatus Hermodarchaeota archaeon]